MEKGNEKLLLDGISLEISEFSIVSLVGGSGSGKTTAGLALLRLLPVGLTIKRGEITYKDENLLKASSKRIQQIRGKEISMVFQEPLYAFNPVFSIGSQINEVLELHTSYSKEKRKERIWELLDMVGIKDPKRVANNYPHQLSGGMRQRAMIAQAIATNPKLIIADEPTSNLDVTLQAKIMKLFVKLKEELKLSILLISHDLGVVENISDKVVVMYEGKIVEAGDTASVFNEPKAEYTQRLLEVSKFK